MTVAVCYVASAGYMFQTALSALQAREHAPDPCPVYVVFLVDGPADRSEAELFGRVLQPRGVQLLLLDVARLEGLPPIFGRYFVGSILPDDVERVLYLDGDTQILAQLGPVLDVTPPERGVVASRDPMVFLREIDARQRVKIDRWWDQSRIPSPVRSRYINSGAFLVDRDFLSELARDVRRHVGDHPQLVFADQDALNVVLGDRITLMSMRWNFPGFLLGTAAEVVTPPTVVHFMSQPRPWQAPLNPWGRAFYDPYAALAADEPEIEPYWQRFDRLTSWRYVVQQAYKAVAERRALSGHRPEAVMRALESSVDVTPDL